MACLDRLHQSRHQQRLSGLINQFTLRYQSLHVGPENAPSALVQLWIPKHASGGTCLTTQGAPFAVLGWSSDALAMYRNYVSHYQPDCESISSTTRCPICRVYANLPPDAADADNGTASPTGSSSSSSSSTEAERSAAAQLAGIHSTLLLSIYDAHNSAQLTPVAVFELAQRETQADFSSAVSTLAEIAQECGFWIPVYTSSHPRKSVDIPLLPCSSRGSSAAPADAAHASTPGVCSSSWLIVEAPPAPGLLGKQQPQQQQQQAWRHRRSSVIYEEHLEYAQPKPVSAECLSTTGGQFGNLSHQQSLLPVCQAASGSTSQVHMQQQQQPPLESHVSLPSNAQQSLDTIEPCDEFWGDADAAAAQQSMSMQQSMPAHLPTLPKLHDDVSPGFTSSTGSILLQQQRHKSMPPQLPHHVHWGQLPPQQHQPVLQRLPWDLLQQQLQQQQYWDDSSNTRLPVWQQYGEEQFLSGVLPHVRQDSRGASMPLPSLAQLTLAASSSRASERVRAIVTVGGHFRQTGTAGGWEYVGGVQKVVSLTRAANHEQIMELLASKALAGGGSLGAAQIHVKYALPGITGSFIELASDDDVLNMFEELDDYNASAAGAMLRLQLYVDSTNSSSRGSCGSDDSSRLTSSLRSPWSGLMQLQPSTPTTEPSEPASGLPYTAAQLGLQPWTSGTGTTNTVFGAGTSNAPQYAAAAQPDALQAMMAAAFRAPWVSAALPNSMMPMAASMMGPTAAVPGAHAAAAGIGDHETALSDQLTSDHLIAFMHMSPHGYEAGAERCESEPNMAMLRIASSNAAHPPEAEPLTGSFSIGGRLRGRNSTSTKTQQPQHQPPPQQQQEEEEVQKKKNDEKDGKQKRRRLRRSVTLPGQGKRDPYMQKLLDQLKVQVEVIRPSELHVVRFIGGGAFGEVFLAKWHGTEVAVKCLSPTLLTLNSSSSGSSARNEAAAELMREASILAQMRHPNIVSVFGVVLPTRESDISSVHDVGHHADMEYGACSSGPGLHMSLRHGNHVSGPAVVFEYMAAGSVQSAIRSEAEWLKSSMAKAKVMLDTARGLGYLHSKSMVHFDLKSANLLFTIKDRTPTVKVADFGLSKQRHQTYVTGVDSMRGTLPWIAPEIIKNPANVTEAADIYSYGVIMWELWTGREPFEGVHLHALLHQLTSQGSLSLPVPGSPEWGDDAVPAEPAPGWRALMLRCWCADSSDRPTSKQLIGELDDMMTALRKLKK